MLLSHGLFNFYGHLDGSYFLNQFLVVLGLCCVWAFSSCNEQGLLFLAVHGPRCGGFSCCRAQALSSQALVVAP